MHLLRPGKLCQIRPPKQNKPWIRHGTLTLIWQRGNARLSNDYEERRLHKEVRRSVRMDRTVWVEACLADGSWDALRKLRRPPSRKQGRLRDASGELVSSEFWADTMATYLEEVQWRVRPTGLVDGPMRGPTLPVRLQQFSDEEVEHAINTLRRNKASGPDDIPAEYWQTLAEGERGLQRQTDLCNACWREQCVP